MLNRTRRYTTLMLALSATVPVFAQGPGNPPPLPAEIIAQYDTDQDGVLSETEMQAMRTAEFKSADVNGDGNLSLTELQGFESSKKSERLNHEFGNLDADSNGVISAAEFVANQPEESSATLATLFGLADTNADAGLSLTEFAALKGEEGHLWQHFAHLDSDGNGVISQDEFTALPPAPPGGEGRGARPAR
ncbi:EF-hand domain-containing protein [Beggiatoa leptomitoformis]|uniref:EF-hand domain-containing protein n=1 Tax=Beggiatoa leptomitoformis TaxID=288004 RepID=A0A2N9YFC9_9GAMM|nr:EF-hand domain-containing protein [Beggiatoa leptomitoformis]AUI69177.1 hypothetical protein BLE401_11030 [Beggiatoa leptomitoformis]QGX03751.1 hypothetical protein AL038_19210 [Beggiatoa leptomitoformis]